MSSETSQLVSRVRTATNLSDSQIGQLLGVDRVTVWTWRTGRRAARARQQADLRRILRNPAAASELARRAEGGLLRLGPVARLLKQLEAA